MTTAYTDTTYNGWTNYATWRVNLEIVEDYRENWIDSRIEDETSPEDIDRYDEVQHLESLIDDVLTNYGQLQDGFALDYARSFVSDANLYEIVDTLIADLTERIAYAAS